MIVVYIIVGLLFLLLGSGIWLTFGPGTEELRDAIDEHAQMHELGIAHGHGGNKTAWELSGTLNHKHDDDQSSST